jgi:hypothetical protein
MCFTYSKQQQKAKMPAAGATQAHRLFCDPLLSIIPPFGSAHRERGIRIRKFVLMK